MRPTTRSRTRRRPSRWARRRSERWSPSKYRQQSPVSGQSAARYSSHRRVHVLDLLAQHARLEREEARAADPAAAVFHHRQGLRHVAVVPEQRGQLGDPAGVVRIVVHDPPPVPERGLRAAALVLQLTELRPQRVGVDQGGRRAVDDLARGSGVRGVEPGQRPVQRRARVPPARRCRGTRRPAGRRRPRPARSARAGSNPRRATGPGPGSAPPASPWPRARPATCRRRRPAPGARRGSGGSTKRMAHCRVSRSASSTTAGCTGCLARLSSPRSARSFSQALRVRRWPTASRTTVGLCGKRSRALTRTQSAHGTRRTRVPTRGCSGISSVHVSPRAAREDRCGAEARRELVGEPLADRLAGAARVPAGGPRPPGAAEAREGALVARAQVVVEVPALETRGQLAPTGPRRPAAGPSRRGASVERGAMAAVAQLEPGEGLVEDVAVTRAVGGDGRRRVRALPDPARRRLRQPLGSADPSSGPRAVGSGRAAGAVEAHLLARAGPRPGGRAQEGDAPALVGRLGRPLDERQQSERRLALAALHVALHDRDAQAAAARASSGARRASSSASGGRWRTSGPAATPLSRRASASFQSCPVSRNERPPVQKPGVRSSARHPAVGLVVVDAPGQGPAAGAQGQARRAALGRPVPSAGLPCRAAASRARKASGTASIVACSRARSSRPARSSRLLVAQLDLRAAGRRPHRRAPGPGNRWRGAASARRVERRARAWPATARAPPDRPCPLAPRRSCGTPPTRLERAAFEQLGVEDLEGAAVSAWSARSSRAQQERAAPATRRVGLGRAPPRPPRSRPAFSSARDPVFERVARRPGRDARARLCAGRAGRPRRGARRPSAPARSASARFAAAAERLLRGAKRAGQRPMVSAKGTSSQARRPIAPLRPRPRRRLGASAHFSQRRDGARAGRPARAAPPPGGGAPRCSARARSAAASSTVRRGVVDAMAVHGCEPRGQRRRASPPRSVSPRGRSGAAAEARSARGRTIGRIARRRPAHGRTSRRGAGEAAVLGAVHRLEEDLLPAAGEGGTRELAHRAAAAAPSAAGTGGPSPRRADSTITSSSVRAVMRTRVARHGPVGEAVRGDARGAAVEDEVLGLGDGGRRSRRAAGSAPRSGRRRSPSGTRKRPSQRLRAADAARAAAGGRTGRGPPRSVVPGSHSTRRTGIAGLDPPRAQQRARRGQEGRVGRDELVALGERDDLLDPLAPLALGLDARQQVVDPRARPAARQVARLERPLGQAVLEGPLPLVEAAATSSPSAAAPAALRSGRSSPTGSRARAAGPSTG